MAIEKLGVRIANPECTIHIEGQSFAELICYQHLHTENLRHVVLALHELNPGGQDEGLANIQINLQALANTSADALQDYLRMALAQGLRFEISQAKQGCH